VSKVLGRRQAIKENGTYRKSLHQVITLRTVVVVRMSVRWPLLGGASGRFDGGLFCQLRVREQVLELEE